MSKKYLNSEKHRKEHSKWDRRGFMKVLGLAGAGSISLGSTNLSVLNSNFISNELSNSISDRVIVLVRLKGGNDRLNTIIYTSLEVIRKISFMLYPIIPDSIEKALKIFNLNTKDINLESIATHNNLKVGSNFNKIDILFKKIEKKND